MYLTQAIHKAAREKPTATATIFQGHITTFAEFKQRVGRFAGGLLDLGTEPGDRVGILALNSDLYLEFIFGTFWAGAAINPVNIRWSLDEIAYSLNDCDTRVLLIDEQFRHLIEPLCQRCPRLTTLIYIGEDTAPSGTLAYKTWLAGVQPRKDALSRGQQLAAVLYTGGTTGIPKGVMLSHDNLASNALSALAASPRPLITSSLHVAPMFHVGGIASVLQTTLRCATHVVLRQFDTAAVLNAIAQHRVNETFLVPTMLQRMLDDPGFPSHDLSAMKNIIYGAAPIDTTLLQRAITAFPNCQFMQVYGMTELAPVAAVLPAYYHTPEGQTLQKLKAAGRPSPVCELRIVDTDGQEVASGQTGEIIVRGPSVMLGYWNKPEETAKALRDGWMHTGDGGYLDKDGFLFITDRIKDMIVTGGENVYSSEVENALLSHPDVQMCAVIGVPHDQWGESVHAIIVPSPGAEIDIEALKLHCRSRIASYKCPRSLELRLELPLSAAGKVLKFELRAPFWKA